ncbi:hypothetical protein [Candidatus Harpocratesius sp.]
MLEKYFQPPQPEIPDEQCKSFSLSRYFFGNLTFAIRKKVTFSSIDRKEDTFVSILQFYVGEKDIGKMLFTVDQSSYFCIFLLGSSDSSLSEWEQGVKNTYFQILDEQSIQFTFLELSLQIESSELCVFILAFTISDSSESVKSNMSAYLDTYHSAIQESQKISDTFFDEYCQTSSNNDSDNYIDDDSTNDKKFSFNGCE